MCSTVKTQITSSSFQVLVRRKSYIFPFFDSTSTFFLMVNGSVLGARPRKIGHGFSFYLCTTFWMRSWRNAWHSQDWTWLFSLPLYYFLDAFLKKRMALTTWQSEVKPYWMQSINFYIRVTVIQSWWKIKFNEQKKNSSACFYSLNQHYLT